MAKNTSKERFLSFGQNLGLNRPKYELTLSTETCFTIGPTQEEIQIAPVDSAGRYLPSVSIINEENERDKR